MTNKSKILVKIISFVFVANFLVVNFALAQTQPPAASDIKIDAAKLGKAQKDEQACRDLSVEVLRASLNNFTTLFDLVPNRNGVATSCKIVPAQITVPITSAGRVYQPIGSQNIQTQIEQGKGISASTFATAAQQDKNDLAEASVAGKIIGWILNTLLSTIATVIGQFTAIAGTIFDSAVNQSLSITTLPVIVTVGWTIVRDICNMFFILALIVIALAAILRIEEYDYKHLLREVILMALLVNFSQIIAVTIMNAVNFVAAVFYGQGFGLSQIYATLMQIVGGSDSAGALWGQVTTGGWQAGLGIGLGKLAFSVVGLVVFVALAGMFVLRIIGLYVLIIFSPVAYVARILPITEKFSEEWWSHFFKYLIWAPVALFMLRLAMLLPKSGGLDGFNTGNNSSFAYFILTGFMLAAFLVAEEAGMVGSKMIMSGVHSIQHGVTHGLKELGGGAVGFAGRAWTGWVSKKQKQAEEKNDAGALRFWKTAQFANLRVAREAWEERSKDKEMEVYKPAVGSVRDTLNRIMPTEWQKDEEGKFHLGQKTYYGRIGQRAVIAHKAKEWEEAGLPEEDINIALDDAHHADDIEALAQKEITGRHEDGHQIMLGLKRRGEREEELVKEITASMAASGTAATPEQIKALAKNQAIEEVGAEFDSVEWLEEVVNKFRHAGIGEDEIARRVSVMDEVGEKHQMIRAIGNSVREFDGKFRVATDMSGYQKLEEAKGSDEMLKELADLGVGTVRTSDIMDPTNPAIKIGEKIDHIEFTDGSGSVHTIRDFASLNSAMEASVTDASGHEIKGKARRVLRNKGGDLKYELAGARKDISANKRMMRGDSERWARAQEPAAYMVQDENGNFTNFTSYGRRRFKNVSSASVNTFRKTRGGQARVIKIVGLTTDKDGKLAPANFNYEAMSEALDNNFDFAAAIMQKTDLIDDTIRTGPGVGGTAFQVTVRELNRRRARKRPPLPPIDAQVLFDTVNKKV